MSIERTWPFILIRQLFFLRQFLSNDTRLLLQFSNAAIPRVPLSISRRDINTDAQCQLR
jgi:hypothetical protein